MKSSHNRTPRHGREDGQVLMLFGLFSLVLILFVGLGIDMGFAYVTKAQLSKAIDAAGLAAIANYSSADAAKGNPTAIGIADSTFWANYATNGVSGRATGAKKVTPTFVFGQDPVTSNITVTASASTTINTFFLRVLPQWSTLTVGDTAVSTRSPVVMTLVLDRSGSMAPNAGLGGCDGGTRGGEYLPAALTEFINIFDETLDQAAVVTFATSSSNDVRMTHLFKTGTPSVITTINRIAGTSSANWLWAGHTCTMAGLTNALVIQNSINAPNAIKVVVLFTDGQANTITATLPNTTPPGGITLNFGGNDPIAVGCSGPTPGASFWRTNLAETVAIQNGSVLASVIDGGSATFSVGTTSVVTTTQYTDSTGAHLYSAYSITEDATNRCVLLGNQMRTSSNYVYAVGLSVPGELAPPTLEQLQQVANDPASSTFDPTLPVGAAFISDGNDLTEVFQQVASDIILRLVH
jgi:Flp pilus assembly protein TadG